MAATVDMRRVERVTAEFIDLIEQGKTFRFIQVTADHGRALNDAGYWFVDAADLSVLHITSNFKSGEGYAFP